MRGGAAPWTRGRRGLPLALLLQLPACAAPGITEEPPCCSSLDPFPVNVVVLTANPAAPTATSLHPSAQIPGLVLTGPQVLAGEIDLLNAHFVDASGGPVCDGADCVSFTLQSMHFRDEIADSGCALLDFGDMRDPMYLDEADPEHVDLSDGVEDAVYACDDERIVAPRAINLYVYDEYRWRDGEADPGGIDSRGRSAERRGVYHPYVVLDLERLQHQTQSPEEHEMGHAFSLGHVCDPAVKRVTHDSNIMGSTCSDCEGGPEAPSGGARNLGFGVVSHDGGACVLDQVQTIIDRAREIQAAWAESP